MVDDEPGMVRAVERVLGGVHRVVGSQSSADAVAIATEFNPDLVVLDIRMPGLDGFELMVRLKADQPDVDIILMTGSLVDLDQKLIRAIRGRAFYFIQKPFDREVLQTLVERCLELRCRREENRRHVHRLEKELGEARAFQQGLLPAAEMVIDRLSLCSRYVSCSELGGDLFDYVSIGSGKVALLVADVMGHGVSAAMLTGVVKSACRASDAHGYEPRAVVGRLWNNMAAFGPEKFVTLIAAVLSIEEGRLHYVNAGHPAGLLRTKEQVWCASRAQDRSSPRRFGPASGRNRALRLARVTCSFYTRTELRTHLHGRTTLAKKPSWSRCNSMPSVVLPCSRRFSRARENGLAGDLSRMTGRS